MSIAAVLADTAVARAVLAVLEAFEISPLSVVYIQMNPESNAKKPIPKLARMMLSVILICCYSWVDVQVTV
jgi:hypothetical protein